MLESEFRIGNSGSSRPVQNLGYVSWSPVRRCRSPRDRLSPVLCAPRRPLEDPLRRRTVLAMAMLAMAMTADSHRRNRAGPAVLS